MPAKKRAIAACTGCGDVKPIVSRGECATCYKRRRRAQRLDKETGKTPEQSRRDNAAYYQRKRDAGYVRRIVDGRRQWVKK